jgi:hypothetical protein
MAATTSLISVKDYRESSSTTFSAQGSSRPERFSVCPEAHSAFLWLRLPLSSIDFSNQKGEANACASAWLHWIARAHG